MSDDKATANTISVSPRLRRTKRKTTVGGLGYINAALLLWIESSKHVASATGEERENSNTINIKN